jgi:hypothetical protein
MKKFLAVTFALFMGAFVFGLTGHSYAFSVSTAKTMV